MFIFLYISIFCCFCIVKVSFIYHHHPYTYMVEIMGTKRNIIERLLKKGLTTSDIMRHTGFSRSWISETRQRMERDELNEVAAKRTAYLRGLKAEATKGAGMSNGTTNRNTL